MAFWRIAIIVLLIGATCLAHEGQIFGAESEYACTFLGLCIGWLGNMFYQDFKMDREISNIWN